jgi:molybdopterin-containing oxidoreductase family iron-sulfur binding subunit
MRRDESPGTLAAVPATGKAYWRSLDELADTPAFREWVERRFPQSMRELLDGAVDRRRFLHLMAASLGLAGLAGCRRPESFVLPYAKAPEDVLPGLPTFYATAMPRPGSAVALLVESHEGRPTKVEGNPKHPDSAGASDLLAQASVLDLYDPDRSRTVLHVQKDGNESSWGAFEAFAAEQLTGLRARKGEGLHVLSGDVDSPALELLREHMHSALPSARWHVHEPIGRKNIDEGISLAFGESLTARYRFDRARVVVALDADILGLESDGGRHVGDFARSRQVASGGDAMGRLYAVESTYSITGGMADHRLRLPSSQVAEYALSLAREVLEGPLAAAETGKAALADALAAARPKPSLAVDSRWVREVAADLAAHRGASLVVAGRRQPALVHALAHALNDALGNIGETVEYRREKETPPTGSLKDLAGAMGRGEVKTLVLLGVNPVYDAPADLGFAELLFNPDNTKIHLGTHVDESGRLAQWHLPMAHYLESWGDARTGDGTIVPIQPLIEPLFGGRTALEVIARLTGFETTAPYEIVRRAVRKVSGSADAEFEAAWRRFLHDGLLAGSARPTVTPRVKWDAIAKAVAAIQPVPPPSMGSLELVFDRDLKVDDGRYAGNGWLQEVPDPITKLAWDNAALFSPATARELGVQTGDLVRLELDGRSLEIAAFVLPGQADLSVAVALGYGRTGAGRVGNGVGFNAYTIRSAAAPDIALGLKVSRTGRKYALACTQDHFTMDGRDLVRETTPDGLRAPASHPIRHESDGGDIQVKPALDGEHQWGMVIDLNTCVGCNACTVACQSENNIPIVGKPEVVSGREMHWIRLDRYFAGDEADPRLVHQPVACMQCESAPCEVVCPVNATIHSDEGLNVMVYSRCIGTRYCLNNCPYKVRRFNFYNYNERPLDQLKLGPLGEFGMPETLKMQKNPDVSVRTRGVMEKCTYCVQRIERARIGAHVEAGTSGHTAIPDGTVVPACAQACPARAIVFGDLSDPGSRVSRLRAENESRNYALLGELNTRPRTTYLARVRNPNPKMPAAGSAGAGGFA